MSTENRSIDTHDLLVLAQFAETDIGNGRRFAYRLRDEFRYCPGRGWFHYDDTRWRPCSHEHVLPAAKRVAEHIKDEARVLSHDLMQLRQKWAAKNTNLHALKRMIECGRTEPPLLIRTNDLDRDVQRLNVANATLLLPREGVQRCSQSARDLITQLAPTLYEPGASSSLWKAHLERVLPDPEVRSYVKRIFGCCLSGTQRDAAFFIFQGDGCNGKSKSLNVIRSVLGDYAKQLDVRVLLDSDFEATGDTASPRLADLAGDTRLVTISEPGKRNRLNEGLVKLLTGSTPISVRRLHQPPFEFTPRFKMILECNSLPKITGDDDGIWRRIKVVPWHARIEPSELDLDIEAKLLGEASGILNWLIEGVAEYWACGLDDPPAVLAEIAKYRGASSEVQDWVAERVECAAGATVSLHDLREDFDAWAVARDRRPPPRDVLMRGLRAYGIRAAGKHSRSRRVMCEGARLRTPSPLVCKGPLDR